MVMVSEIEGNAMINGIKSLNTHMNKHIFIQLRWVKKKLKPK